MDKIRVAVIIPIIAAAAFWAGGQYGTKEPNGPGEQEARKVLYYSDPMNPGFRSDKPGVAPCGMPLEPVYADAGENPHLSLPRGAVQISAERQQLIGVKTATAEASPMTYTLRLYGKVVPDETRVYRVNASTDSWIRELSDVTTGSIVRKDQILAEALAPAYYNAQVTYLLALDNMDRIKQQLGGQLRHQQSDLANNQIRVAVQALQNLGIGDAQVEELADTRQARPYLQVRAPSQGIVLRRNISRNQWFKAADEFYTIADIRRVWIYSDVYENEARHLGAGMAVRVKHAQLGRTYDARVSEVIPLFDPVSKTLKVRLDVNNPRYELRPDMFVDVEIPVTMPPALHVPSDAVIDSGTKVVVYVETGEGVFEPRKVETGWRLGRQVEISGGIKPGERVVVSGNFLIDSESRMKAAGSGPEIATSNDPVCGMDVDEAAAENAGRTAAFAGRTYYFCSDRCVQAFKNEQNRFIGKQGQTVTPEVMPERNHGRSGAAKPVKIQRVRMPISFRSMPQATGRSADAGTSRDPVCGMDVDNESAENARRTALLDGKTFYFCSDHCVQVFKREPDKFTGKARTVLNPSAMTEMDRSSEETAQHGTEGQRRGLAVAEPDRETAEEHGRPSSSPEVIDWGGPKTEKNDWKGWGKFPGAEYLGLKHRDRKASGMHGETAGEAPAPPPRTGEPGADRDPRDHRGPDGMKGPAQQ